MKRHLLLSVCAFAALAMACDHASAGPNAGGTLIVHGDAGVVYTNDIDDYTGASPLPGGCSTAETNYPADEHFVWWVKAVFPESTSPRLLGVTFGVDYDAAAIVLEGYGASGDFELADPNWPEPQSGTAVTFQNTQTAWLVDLYWFAGYNYSGYGTDVSFDLAPNPSQGAYFADDDVPSTLDPIEELGSLGFGANPGYLPCPTEFPTTGACCFPDLFCSMLTEDECNAEGGTYQGNNVPCDPNPCEGDPPTGACCSDGGSCSFQTQEDCEDASSHYLGDGAPCSPDPCPKPGACCFGEDCVFMGQFDCEDEGGVPQGSESSCDPNPCSAPTGACCYPDGSCRFLNEADCDLSQGTYQGDDTSCDPNPCPPPPTGACCSEDGTCEVLSLVDCESASGQYLGDDVACEPNPCVITPIEERSWGQIKNGYRPQ